VFTATKRTTRKVVRRVEDFLEKCKMTWKPGELVVYPKSEIGRQFI